MPGVTSRRRSRSAGCWRTARHAAGYLENGKSHQRGTEMLAAHLRTVITRELRALAREMRAYPDDASVRRTFPGVSNSAGTLALPLSGNIQHYVGAKLGGTSYQRARAAELARRDGPRAQLLAESY